MKPTEKSLSVLLRELYTSLSDENRVVEILRYLQQNVTSFGDEFEVLESFVQQFDCSRLSETKYEIWKDFLIDAVTAFPQFCFPCVHSIIMNFQQDRPSQDENLANVYRATLLNSILFVSPDSILQIVSCLRKYFPHHYRQETILVKYYNTLLYLADAIEDLRKEIWRILVEGLVRLDSEIPRHFFNHYGEFLANVKREKVNIMQFLQKAGITSGFSHHDSLILAAKLDSLLTLMMTNLSQIKYFESGSIRRKTVRHLVDIFTSSVLPAYDLSSVHFLWFHLCSLYPKLLKRQIATLWTIFQDPSASLHERQMSIFYVSGLIARMTTINRELSDTVISMMVDWCKSYHRDSTTSFCFTPAKRSKHLIFYSVFQSLMYSLVYLSHQVIWDGCSERYIAWCQFFSTFELDKIIHSQLLNPLAYCDQKVVEAFAKITSQMQLLLCYPIIHKNKRLVSLMKPRNLANPSSSHHGLTGDSTDSICIADPSFYPYDPLTLPLAGTLVEQHFRFWKDLDSSLISNHIPHSSTSSTNEVPTLITSTATSITNSVQSQSRSSFEKFIEEQLDESSNGDNMQLSFIEQIVSSRIH